MEDFQNYCSHLKTSTRQLQECAQDSSPFLYSVSTKTLKGAGAGFFLTSLFFKSRNVRRAGLLFGAGFGLGLSSSQTSALWHTFQGTLAQQDLTFYNEIENLEQELKLRYKLK